MVAHSPIQMRFTTLSHLFVEILSGHSRSAGPALVSSANLERPYGSHSDGLDRRRAELERRVVKLNHSVVHLQRELEELCCLVSAVPRVELTHSSRIYEKPELFLG